MSASASQATTPGSAALQPTRESTTASTSSPATPAESAEAYENICGICFTEIHPVDNPRGTLNSCHHLFCSFCIKEWAKSTNVCPTCKARFTRIYTLLPDTAVQQETKVRKRNYAAWDASEEDEDEDGEDEVAQRESALLASIVCDICRQSHNAARMIFCDRRQCTYVAHLDCLDLAERPVTFLCTACTKLRESGGDGVAPVGEMLAAAPSTGPASSPTASPPPSPAPRQVVSRGRGRVAAQPPAVSTTAASSQFPSSPPQRRDDVSTSETHAHAPTSRPARGASTAPPSSVAQPRRPQRTGVLESSSNSSSSPSSSRPSSSAAPPSSGSSSAPAPAPAPAAPRKGFDFSKSHLHLIEPQSSSPRDAQQTAPAAAVDDDYYFLAPTSHAVAAAIDLDRFRQTRADEAQGRQQRNRATTERLQAMYGVRPSYVRLDGAPKPGHASAADDVAAELDSAEKEFNDPQQRRMMEARMVRKRAADILPVLRRRRYIDGDTVTTEGDLWAEATAQAQQMVRDRLDAKAESLRRRREQLVLAQAQREAAALVKLARIIAQHRELAQRTASPR